MTCCARVTCTHASQQIKISMFMLHIWLKSINSEVTGTVFCPSCKSVFEQARSTQNWMVIQHLQTGLRKETVIKATNAEAGVYHKRTLLRLLHHPERRSSGSGTCDRTQGEQAAQQVRNALPSRLTQEERSE